MIIDQLVELGIAPPRKLIENRTVLAKQIARAQNNGQASRASPPL